MRSVWQLPELQETQNYEKLNTTIKVSLLCIPKINNKWRTVVKRFNASLRTMSKCCKTPSILQINSKLSKRQKTQFTLGS